MTNNLAFGTKYTCQNLACVTRFYDLNKDPAACPKCGQKVPVIKAPVLRKRRITRENLADGSSKHHIVITTDMPKRVKWKTGFSG
jgi:uncharacterized protein (TIGR02300 family)